MVEEMDAQLKVKNFLHPQVQSPKGCHHTPSSLADETQMPYPNLGSLKKEGMPQH